MADKHEQKNQLEQEGFVPEAVQEPADALMPAAQPAEKLPEEKAEKKEKSPAALRQLAEQAPAKKARNKKPWTKKRVIGLVAAILALALVANFILSLLAGSGPTPVQLSEVVRTDVLQVLGTTGTITTGDQRTVFSTVSAPIKEVLVEKGSYVQADDQMFTYELTDLERAYRQAAASRGSASSSAQQQLDASDQNQRTAEDLDAKIAELNKKIAAEQEKIAVLAAQLAPLEADRAALIAGGAPETDPAVIALDAQIAPLKKQLTDAQALIAQWEKEKAQLDAQREAARKGILSDEQKKQLESGQVPAQVALEVALQNLNNGKKGITAPISGIVTNVSVVPGGMASQYSVLCVIESLTKVDVVIALSRYDLERVQEGQAASVTTLGKEYSAEVLKIDGMATQTATGSYVAATVRITAPDTDITLGLEANVEIETGLAKNVLAVPLSAVNTDVDGTYCYIFVEGFAQRQELTLGLSSDTMVEVTSGLAEGDQVILSSQNIAEGMEVVDAPAAAGGGNGFMMTMGM